MKLEYLVVLMCACVAGCSFDCPGADNDANRFRTRLTAEPDMCLLTHGLVDIPITGTSRNGECAIARDNDIVTLHGLVELEIIQCVDAMAVCVNGHEVD